MAAALCEPRPAGPVGRRVVAEARAWIGTPYHHQASLRGAGCDCLGLLRGIWRAVYGTEPEAPPPYAATWAEDRGEETLRDAARRHLAEIPLAATAPGDVWLFRWRPTLPAKHCGVISAPGRLIHAYDGHAVTESWIPAAWARRAVYAFRFPEDPWRP